MTRGTPARAHTPPERSEVTSSMSKTVDTRDTRWRLTGFGGWTGDRSFERLIGWIDLRRNGSFVMFSIRFPGEEKPRHFMVTRDDLAAAIEAEHGKQVFGHAEYDAPSELAFTEHNR